MSSVHDVINLKTINFPIGEKPPFDEVRSSLLMTFSGQHTQLQRFLITDHLSLLLLLIRFILKLLIRITFDQGNIYNIVKFQAVPSSPQLVIHKRLCNALPLRSWLEVSSTNLVFLMALTIRWPSECSGGPSARPPPPGLTPPIRTSGQCQPSSQHHTGQTTIKTLAVPGRCQGAQNGTIPSTAKEQRSDDTTQ